MGGGYGKIKSEKVIRVLERLAKESDKFHFERGGKHNYKVKPIFALERSFAIPANHSFINLFIMQALGKRLEAWGVCSEKDFLERLK